MADTITSFTTFAAGTKARSSQVNANFSNFRGSMIPIETDTAAGSHQAHELGTDSHEWIRANIAAGYWRIGDIKPHHTFNGVITSPGQGWMLCNGQTINSTNYDAFHSAGSWTKFVSASTLTGLLTPDLTNRYLTGDTVTTQSGSTTMAFVGNASNQINLQHNHTGGSHNHQWHGAPSLAGAAQSYNSAGTAQSISASSVTSLDCISVNNTLGERDLSVSYWTANDGETVTGNSLSTTQSIQPESLAVQYFIRII